MRSMCSRAYRFPFPFAQTRPVFHNRCLKQLNAQRSDFHIL
jgi:hypothetical protein